VHALIATIRGDLNAALGNADATIHIEPAEKEATMDQLAERLDTVDGVKAVYETSTIYTGGKFYITLPAYVNLNSLLRKHIKSLRLMKKE
jgi:hypothetical protein